MGSLQDQSNEWIGATFCKAAFGYDPNGRLEVTFEARQFPQSKNLGQSRNLKMSQNLSPLLRNFIPRLV